MDLLSQSCRHGAPPLDEAAIAALLPQLPLWGIADGVLRRRYRFPRWQAGMAFANAVSAMVEQQDHHPLLTMTYSYCELGFITHDAGNTLTLNDFICAARADVLYDEGQQS